MDIQEVEKMEKAVRGTFAPYYFGDSPGLEYRRDFALEKFLDDKVIYYIKLGVKSEDLVKRIKEREANLKERESNQHK